MGLAGDQIIVAMITTVGLVVVAYLQFGVKQGKSRHAEQKSANEMFLAQWAQNKVEHQIVLDKIDDMGAGLVRSIDVVRDTVRENSAIAANIEKKLDTHIRDHATGAF